MNLINGNCLEEMKKMKAKSVDLVFCDLPYGQTSCKWDCCIDLEEFWKEIMRIKKTNTAIIMTTTTKFGISLIQSAPKKCPFRYDLVWCKSAPAGFLSAKKMPMRKHEMIYVFYEKLPFYDLSSHKHKFIKETPMSTTPDIYGRLWDKNGKPYLKNKIQNKYDPTLPTSLVKEDCNYDVTKNIYGGGEQGRIKISKDKKDHVAKYDPPLPTSLVKEDVYGNPDRDIEEYKLCGKKGRHQVLYDPPLPNSLLEIKSTRGKHSTEKPVKLMEWILKYYSKEGDLVLDPTMGSGSLGVACKNMNRNFIGFELDENIFKVAKERLESSEK